VAASSTWGIGSGVELSFGVYVSGSRREKRVRALTESSALRTTTVRVDIER
jgi:hypothetical protein